MYRVGPYCVFMYRYFYNVLPCVNYFDEGGVGDYKKGAVTECGFTAF